VTRTPDSGLNARGSRAFIDTVHKAAAVIGRRRSQNKKGQAELGLATNVMLI